MYACRSQFVRTPKLPRMLRAPRASRAPGTIPKLPRADAEVNVVVNE